MTTLRNFVMAGALAVSSVLPAGVAQAGPMPAPIKVDRTSDVTNVRIVCDAWGCRRVWRPRRVYVAPRIVIREPRVIVRPRLGYNAHVRWCLNRYRSYNPATNLYVSYGGYYKRCISPY